MGIDTAGFAEWCAVVAGQHGVVTRAQALACGLTVDAIRERLERGRWRQVYRGVYVVHTGPPDWLVHAQAALLRAGPCAALCLLSAAYLIGLADSPGMVIHIAIPADRRVTGSLPGVRVHRSNRCDADVHPSRTPRQTRVEATVLDLVAASTNTEDAIGWLTAACQRRLTTPARLLAAASDRGRLRHRNILDAVLADVADGAHSPLEVAHLRKVERAHALPRGERQRRVAGSRVHWVDVDYMDLGVRVELDGRLGHVEDGGFRDRARDNRAARDGVTTLRYGFAEVLGDPCGVALEQAQVLRAHGWTGRPRSCGPDCKVPSE